MKDQKDINSPYDTKANTGTLHEQTHQPMWLLHLWTEKRSNPWVTIFEQQWSNDQTFKNNNKRFRSKRCDFSILVNE